MIPADGEVVEGVASVDESAITGESAPVIREAGGDHSGVTGGTRVLSDRIVVQVTAEPGQSFLDRMIALVEGAIRQKTPNEIALTIVLAAFSIIFLIVTATLYPMARYFDLTLDIPTLIALAGLPDPDDHRRPAGGDRHRGDGPGAGGQHHRQERQGGRAGRRRRHAAAGQDRHDHDRQPPGDPVRAAGRGPVRARWPGWPGWPRWPTRRPRARASSSWPASRRPSTARRPAGATFIEFTAQTRMSGIDLPDGVEIRKGAPDTIARYVEDQGGTIPDGYQATVDAIASGGATPAGRRRGRPHRRRHQARGHPQARHPRAVRPAPPDGPARRDGHRRQPADGQGHRRGGRRRRLHRPGHPRGQARLHPQGAERRQARGHDGRRHQRRPRAGAGRHRRGDELRHPGRQGGRQHGRPRQRPHQAHRGRRDRQAAADDPRGADDLLDRQRPGQVLRRDPGDVHRDPAGAAGARPDGPGDAGAGRTRRSSRR